MGMYVEKLDLVHRIRPLLHGYSLLGSLKSVGRILHTLH